MSPAWCQEGDHGSRPRAPGPRGHGDCRDPVRLYFGKTYTHEQSPRGHGTVQEFHTAKRNTHLFPAEINTVWYRFTTPADGVFTFEIIPFDTVKDDYDWMLFKMKGTATCDSLADYGILPLRANRARNDRQIQGRTGLAEEYINPFAPPGPGLSYSSPVEARQGSTYLLVVDNIYPGGEGHKISLNYTSKHLMKPVRIRGRVIDKETRQPLTALLSVEYDNQVLPAESVQSDAGSGAFEITTYSTVTTFLSFNKKGYLLSTHLLRSHSADTSVLIEMEPVVKGGKMQLFTILFLPNSAEFRPGTEAGLRRLLDFLNETPGKVIRITGHTNANVFSRRSYLTDLSVKRAAAVRDYLLLNGIDRRRIRIAGAGGSKPLVKTHDRQEAMKNLRVEIEILN